MPQSNGQEYVTQRRRANCALAASGHTCVHAQGRTLRQVWRMLGKEMLQVRRPRRA
jgi:hypothetical protein